MPVVLSRRHSLLTHTHTQEQEWRMHAEQRRSARARERHQQLWRDAGWSFDEQNDDAP